MQAPQEQLIQMLQASQVHSLTLSTPTGESKKTDGTLIPNGYRHQEMQPIQHQRLRHQGPPGPQPGASITMRTKASQSLKVKSKNITVEVCEIAVIPRFLEITQFKSYYKDTNQSA